MAAELGVGWEERSILEDPSLHERYAEQIPVTLVDGQPHDFWRVSPERLRAALDGLSPSGAQRSLCACVHKRLG